MPLIGWILVIMAGASVIGVLVMVMREPEVHEEWYIPPAPTEKTPNPAAMNVAQADDSGE